jgi:hypothetical protein
MLRLCYFSEHMERDGTLKAAAIRTDELTRQVDGEPQGRGLSVAREAHTSEEQLEEKARNLRVASPTQRAEVWVYKFSADDIRQVLHNDNERAVCLVDRALPNDSSHAEIWGAKAGRDRGQLRAIRDKILPLLRRSHRVA